MRVVSLPGPVLRLAAAYSLLAASAALLVVVGTNPPACTGSKELGNYAMFPITPTVVAAATGLAVSTRRSYRLGLFVLSVVGVAVVWLVISGRYANKCLG